MERSGLEAVSERIIREFHQNNVHTLLDAFSNKGVWMEREIIHTKARLADFLSNRPEPPICEVRDLRACSTDIDACGVVVVLDYMLVPYGTSDGAQSVCQRASLLWSMRRPGGKGGEALERFFDLCVCHISNETPEPQSVCAGKQSPYRRLPQPGVDGVGLSDTVVRGRYGSFFRLAGDSIVRLESKGVHTMIYTLDGVYESTEKMSEIVTKYPDDLFHVHLSHAVNLMFVAEVGRFYVLLEDGTRLPLPEKRYTKIRDELHSRMRERNVQTVECRKEYVVHRPEEETTPV